MFYYKSYLVQFLSFIILINFSNGFLLDIDIKLKEKLVEKYQRPTINVTEKLNRELVGGFLQQRLDHFNPQDTRTWDNIYYENNDYFETGGPVYIFTGGNYFAYPGWMVYGFVHDMAVETDGAIFVSEHRYYGGSRPTEDMSVENMQYLMHDQAMVDLVTLISFIKEDPDYEDSPIILVSHNYGGAIISWFQKRYSHLVDGVWASSSMVEARADLYMYFVVVAEDILLLGGRHCHDRIENGFVEMEEMLDDFNSDGSEFTDMFNLCQDIDTEDEMSVATFMGYIATTIGAFVEYAGEEGVELICAHVEDTSIRSDVEAIASFINFVYDPIYTCLDTSVESFLELIGDEDFDSIGGMAGARQWAYQTCTEFGWFRTSNEDNHPFGTLFPIELFYDVCTIMFGEAFTGEFLNTNIDRVNHNNGGVNPRVSNVIYTTGALDPWRVVSIVDDTIENSDVYVIPGETSSSDLWSFSDDDSEELTEVKNAIRDTILDWITPEPDEIKKKLII